MINIEDLVKLPNEEWRIHPIGVAVSNLGRVYYEYGKTYTYGHNDKDGYKQIQRHKKNYRVHRLVAECFIPNQNKYEQVNHKNEIKSDNRVENLEWCNAQYNLTYGTRLERIRNYFINYKKFSKQVLQINMEGQLIKIWNSTRECARNGYNQGAVAACCRGKYKTYKEFIWKYAE